MRKNTLSPEVDLQSRDSEPGATVPLRIIHGMRSGPFNFFVGRLTPPEGA
jgi:hypothetical protein